MKPILKKERLWLIALPSLAVLLTFCINQFVYYGGDDYSYITVGRLLRQGIGPFLQQNYTNWLNDNGRFLVHLLDSLFLVAPILLWRVLNSVFLGLLVYLPMKLAARHKIFVGTTMLGFVLAMHNTMTRQSVYWITGSFNYLYPLVLVFALWFLLEKYQGKGRTALLCITGFLAGASVEQAAMMAVGVMVLHLIFGWLNRMRPSKASILTLICTVAGAFSVFLAPATFRRMGLEANLSMLETVVQSTKIMISGLFSAYFIPVLLAVLLASTLFLWQTKLPKLRILAVLAGLAIPTSLWVRFTWGYTFTLMKILEMGFVLLVAVIAIGAVLWQIWKEKNKVFPIAATAVIIGGGSLLMMLVSPVFGERNFLFAYFALAFYGAVMLAETYKKWYVVFLAVLLLVGGITYWGTLTGYASNAVVYQENNKLIADWAATDRQQPLVQYKLKDDRYAWSLPYQSEFHERVYQFWLIEYIEFTILWKDYPNS